MTSHVQFAARRPAITLSLLHFIPGAQRVGARKEVSRHGQEACH